MVTPGLLSGRRVPETVRVDFEVVIARAWQALAQTHEEQAVTFVRRLSPRIGTDAALQRCLRFTVGKPEHTDRVVAALEGQG